MIKGRFYIIIGFLVSLSSLLQAQCDAPYVFQKYEPASIITHSDLNYTTIANERQIIDIYDPPTNCSQTDIILLIHGGAFVGGEKSAMDNYAEFFAGYGLVAASMNYRLGLSEYITDQTSCDLLQHKNVDSTYKFDDAWYIALQDARAALRFFKAYTEQLLDKEVVNVYVMGVSAGAITTVNLALVDEEDVQTYRPELIGRNGNPDITTLSTLVDDTIDITTAFSISGTLADLRFLTYQDNDVNIDFFHAYNDPTVPYDVLICEDSDRNLDGAKRVYDQNNFMLSPACINLYYSLRGGHSIYSKFDRQIRDQILQSMNSIFYERHKCSKFSNIVGGESFEPISNAEDTEWGNEVILYPNPASERSGFEFSYDYYTNDADYIIYDKNGNLIIQKSLSVYQGHNYEAIDTELLKEGVYIVKIRVESKVVIKTLSVIRYDRDRSNFLLTD